MYGEKMSELFNNIPVTIPQPNTDYYKNNIQMMLTDIGRKWYIKELRAKPSPLKRPIFINKERKEDNIEENLGKAN